MFNVQAMIASFVTTMAIGSLAATLVQYLTTLHKRQRSRETPAGRIDRLTRSLQEAMLVIEDIKQEIEHRHALAMRLQQDIEIYQNIRDLRKAEVEAIAQVIRGELHTESTRSFWKQVGVNFAFFLMGVVSTVLIGYFMN